MLSLDELGVFFRPSLRPQGIDWSSGALNYDKMLSGLISVGWCICICISENPTCPALSNLWDWLLLSILDPNWGVYTATSIPPTFSHPKYIPLFQPLKWGHLTNNDTFILPHWCPVGSTVQTTSEKPSSKERSCYLISHGNNIAWLWTISCTHIYVYTLYGDIHIVCSDAHATTHTHKCTGKQNYLQTKTKAGWFDMRAYSNNTHT